MARPHNGKTNQERQAEIDQYNKERREQALALLREKERLEKAQRSQQRPAT